MTAPLTTPPTTTVALISPRLKLIRDVELPLFVTQPEFLLDGLRVFRFHAVNLETKEITYMEATGYVLPPE